MQMALLVPANCRTPTFHACSLEAWYETSVTVASEFRVRSLSVRLRGGFETSPLTFSLSAGETAAIVGPISSGKSIIFETLAGIERPRIERRGECVGRVELVPQDARLAVLPTDNVWFVLGLDRHTWLLRKLFGGSRWRSEKEERADELLAQLGLRFARIFDRPMSTLSDGERKRVLCAAALLVRPATLLIDGWEEYADPGLRKPLLRIIEQHRQGGMRLVVSARHAPLLDLHCDRVFELAGRAGVALPLLGASKSGTPPGPVLKVKGLVVEKGSQSWLEMRRSEYPVDGVSFSVNEGQCLCVLGPSGCGKTSLLHALAGLSSPSSGSVYLAERDVTSPKGRRARRLRKEMQLVFQEASAVLDPDRSVLAHLQEASALVRDRDMTAGPSLARVGLPEDLLGTPADQLSASESQRLDLARSLILRPKIVLWDAPECSAADTDGGVLSALLREEKSAGRAFVVATQSPEVAIALGDRVAFMYAGRIVEIGPASALLGHPGHPATYAYTHGEALAPLHPVGQTGGCVYAAHCPKRELPLCEEKSPPLVPISRAQKPERGVQLNHHVACFFPLGADIAPPPPSLSPQIPGDPSEGAPQTSRAERG